MIQNLLRNGILDIFLYAIADLGETGVVSHSEGLDLLDRLGFKTNRERKTCSNIEEVLAYIVEWTEKRPNLPMILMELS